MASYLDKDGLLYVWSKIKALVATKVDKVDGKGLSTNDFTSDYKTKLDGITAGANKTTVDAALSDTSTNPVQNKAINTALGNKVDKVSGKGLSTNDYTAADKTKLEDIEAGAQKNKPAFDTLIMQDNGVIIDEIFASSETHGEMLALSSGQNIYLTVDTNSYPNRIVIGAEDTTYDAATSTSNGLMSKDDKTKLDGIAEGANKTTVDSALSSTSTNPVQNKAINTALGNKVDKVSGKGLSTNDYTTAEKNKLAAFSAASEYAKKTDLTSVYKYKGSKSTKADLPTSGNTTGDVWNVEADDMNYGWDGSKWDALGGSFSVTAITNAEIDTITAS